jgi:hypothetical protein
LDFALAEAHKTNFDIRTLGGTKQYMSAYMALRQRRADKMVSEAVRGDRERQEAKLQAYDMFRRAQAKDTLASLPVAEQQAIEAMARSHTAKFTGSLRDTMFEFAKVRLTIGAMAANSRPLSSGRPTGRPRRALPGKSGHHGIVGVRQVGCLTEMTGVFDGKKWGF